MRLTAFFLATFRGLPVLLASVCGPAHAQFSLNLKRYNSIAETTYELHRCGELTAERRAWLRHVLDHAMRPIDWTAAQWAEHDAGLTRDFERRHASVEKVRCAELSASIDLERKTTVIAK